MQRDPLHKPARAARAKPTVARLQTLANVAGAALLLWLAAPLLVINGRHPLESPIAPLSI